MSTDQAVRLRALLDDLEHGRIAASDAAAQVRTMKFPVPQDKTVAQRMADSYESEAPEPAPPGSFREVALAYHEGRISGRQYEVLAHAAAAAIREQEGDGDGQADEGQADRGGAVQP